MKNVNNKIDYFLLADRWKEPNVCGRICYSIRTDGTKQTHDSFVEETKQRLLAEHDDPYTSWEHTFTAYGDTGHFQPHCSVLHFRVRDAG